MSTPSKGFKLSSASVLYEDQAALLDFDLSVSPGEALAFVGPSGAGKTTALGLCNATIRPTKGAVSLDGEDLNLAQNARLRELRARIGFIPQELGLIPNLRVSQNVLAGRLGRQGLLASLRPLLRAGDAELEKVLAILDRLGIGDKLFHRVDSLSGGERQRVAIARTLYQEADYLIADEPLSALDPARARETLSLLTDVARENELGLILSLHDIELAREFIPRLVGLRAGRVLFDKPAKEVTEEELTELYRLEGSDRVS